MNTTEKHAFDFSPSMRTKDENGFLRVAASHITKETVNPYYGREIPGWQELGLDPEHIYYGYRAGEELQKAAKTFDGLPLLLGHHVESAADPQKEYRVGSSGTDARWNEPYLDNSLFVTDETAIRAIEDGEAKELSCAYLYDPDFTPGEFKGVSYDFVMRNIRGNHIALVEEGRAGSDVVVADAQIQPSNNKLLELLMSIFKRFRGAMDATPEVEPKAAPSVGDVVGIVETLSGLTDEEKQKLLAAINALVVPAKEAADEEPAASEDEDIDEAAKDEGEEPAADEDAENAEPAADEDEPMNPSEAVAAKGEGEEDDKAALMEQMKAAADACGMDADDEIFQKAFLEGVKYGAKQESAVDEDDIKTAMDSAVKRAVRVAKAQSVKHFRALSAAADDVRHVLGNVDALAFDSADDIYGAALKKMGVAISRHPRSAWRSMFAVMKGREATPRAAMDSALRGSFEGSFAGLNRIKY